MVKDITSDSEPIQAVAVADLTNSGYPDLVTGSDAQLDQLYMNQLPVFQQTPPGSGVDATLPFQTAYSSTITPENQLATQISENTVLKFRRPC